VIPHFIASALQVSYLGFIEAGAVAPTGTETQAISAQVSANAMIGLIVPSVLPGLDACMDTGFGDTHFDIRQWSSFANYVRPEAAESLGLGDRSLGPMIPKFVKAESSRTPAGHYHTGHSG
jgi:hypothetical protein